MTVLIVEDGGRTRRIIRRITGGAINRFGARRMPHDDEAKAERNRV